ncbi:MAG: DNA repair protein RecN [Elusimicrobia bacterium]|nr:DNA repair protein RecN [Elusimicrobiota bacterium]
MLTHLSIKNLALLEDDALEFAPGLNVLTGETGAGKSIVLDALGLVLGRRADAGLVREGAARLTVSARFDIGSPRLRKIAEELGVLSEEEPGELLIRREVEAGGKSRAFVNDRPVGLPALARLAERLAYVHGQHEHQLLLKAAEQRDLLDAHGGLEGLRDEVAAAFDAWRTVVAERDTLALSEQERAQRLDLYRYQRQELDAADPRAEEEAVLDQLLPQLKNAEKLRAASEEALDGLSRREGSAAELTRRTRSLLDSLRALGAPLGETADLLDGAIVQLEEAAQRLEAFAGGLEQDPAKLEETLSRLDQLAKLKKKYGPTLADVVAYRARVAGELDRLENLENKNRDMAERLAAAEKQLAARSEKLSTARGAAAKKLDAAINKEFRDVGLPHAVLDIEALAEPGRYTSAGMDEVRFWFTPNPGEGRRPLADVASGGELSRVMLAVKSVLAKTDAVPVLVFDEIDAGVGGALGAVLGRKLAKLGGSHQVLCVTHLATIAACGDRHFVVEKEIQKTRTRTSVRALTETDRVQEIARLFGGTGKESEGDIGLRHARELLESSRR